MSDCRSRTTDPGRRAIKPFRVNVVQFRGSPYEVGRAQAHAFAATAKGRAFLRRPTIARPAWFDVRNDERLFAKISPALWAEIGGIADGLGISLDKAAFCFGNHGWRTPTGGCSAVMGAGVYGRNYDYQPRHYGARLAAVQPRGSYASLGASEMLFQNIY